MSGPAGYDLVLVSALDDVCHVIDRRTHSSPIWESIEGSLSEFVELGHAIETHASFRAKRCAVETVMEAGRYVVRLWNPRNSIGDGARLTLVQAHDLAHSIRMLAAEVAGRLEAGNVR